MYLSLGDNRLLLDLENAAQTEELRSELRRVSVDAPLVLQEALPSCDHAWVPGPGGGFIAELVVPLVLKDNGSAAASERPSLPRADILVANPGGLRAGDRVCPPGSDWLFAKLYCPRAFQDDLLVGPVSEFCEGALVAAAANDWFFIRYADPHSHLRLRFRGPPEQLVRCLIPQLCSWADDLIKKELCSRLCLDTYDREIERYGGAAAIASAEAIFAADSSAVLELLRLGRTGLLDVDMTTLAVLSVDDLLFSLGASEDDRLECYRNATPSKRTAGSEYREFKATLRSLLSDPDYRGTYVGGEHLTEVLADRRRKLAGPAHQIRALTQTNDLSQPLTALYASYVHLHCNRLIGDRNLEETVLGLLYRTRYGLAQSASL